MARALPTNPIRPLLVLATMEVEAWFIGEHTHFQRIDNGLTIPRIQNDLGLNLLTDEVEAFGRPSSDLDAIYQLAGLSYTKRRAEVERTVAALDYVRVRDDLARRTPSFAPLLNAVNAFLQ
jgi:hypothetical protein